MKITEIDIKQLLPLFMRGDNSNAALAEVTSKALQVFAREIAKLSTFDALDKLSGAELDELAEEMRVKWYDKELPNERKRALLANSYKVYMRLGTKSAVQQVVTDIFGESEVEEFFSYGGKPHFFRIRVANAGALSAENEAKLLRLLEEVKRKSQWLETIYSETIAALQLRVGIHVSFQRQAEARLDKWQDNSAASYNAGAAVETKHTDNANI